MKSVEYNNGKAVCPKCGGELSYDARITDKLPMGFGFGQGSKFQIDYVVRRGWRGECMDCYETVFAVVSRHNATKFPAIINRKIEAARIAA